MKLVVEEVAKFKTAVNTAASLVSKNSVSTIEQCVLLTAEDGLVTITASVTDSHSVTFNVPASVNQPGKVFIPGSNLRKITQTLKPKSPVFISKVNGTLQYEVRPFGSISEPLYHDQRGFPNFLSVGSTKGFDLVGQEDDMLPLLLPVVCATSFNNKPIFFQSSPQKFEIYSQYSQTGYTKFITPTGRMNPEPCRLYIKPSLAKIVGALGETIDIFYNGTKNAIAFTGDEGEIVIVGDTVSSNYFNATENVLNLKVDGAVEVNHTDLLNAINWQAYNVGLSDTVVLSVDEGNLTVSCGTNNEPARIVTEVENNFEPLTLHLAPLQVALKAIGSEKSKLMPLQFVRLQQRTYVLGAETYVKILTMSASEELDVIGTALLYEVKMVNR